jgi:methyltransferase family protein
VIGAFRRNRHLKKDVKLLRSEVHAIQANTEQRLHAIEAAMQEHGWPTNGASAQVPDASGLTTLPGNSYARFALPIEYPPSRDLRPRWGYTQPLIQPLAEWFGRYESDYRRLLGAMTVHKDALARIALDFEASRLPEPAWRGVPFAAFDLAALYTIIAENRPRRYLEIGSGISTAFARRAAIDSGFPLEIVSIDPEPRAAIDAICDRVIRDGLETCDLAIFAELEASDVVFMDGSHRSFMNSDVTVFVIDILPHLEPGVLVHVHDVNLPWDYPDMFVNWYWNEQYVLAAYLIGAMDRLKSVFPTSWVCRRPEFDSWFATPLVDLGDANDGWRGGGSMWFTPKH